MVGVYGVVGVICSIAVIRGSGGFFNDRLLVVMDICMAGLKLVAFSSVSFD